MGETGTGTTQVPAGTDTSSAVAPASRGRALVAIAGAVLVVGGALALILLMGSVRPPAFESLAAQPDPAIPGRVAFTTSPPGGEGTCLAIVEAAGGQPTTLACLEDTTAVAYSEAEMRRAAVRWTQPDRILLRGFDALGTLEVVVDLQGRIVERRRIPPGEELSPRPEPGARDDIRADGAYVATTGSWGADDDTAAVVLVEPDGSERPLVEVDGAGRYAFFVATFSPDGRWVLVTDSAERVLVVDADAGGARVLATDAANPAWEPQP